MHKVGLDNVFTFESMGSKGGLVLLWKYAYQLEIQNYSQHHIAAKISAPLIESCWKLTGFYGHLEVSKQEKGWSLLRFLSQLQPFQ